VSSAGASNRLLGDRPSGVKAGLRAAEIAHLDWAMAKDFCTLTDHAISEYELRIEFDCMPRDENCNGKSVYLFGKFTNPAY
jgi:hypothetical protein